MEIKWIDSEIAVQVRYKRSATVEDAVGPGKRVICNDDSDSDSVLSRGSMDASLRRRTAATDVQSWKRVTGASFEDAEDEGPDGRRGRKESGEGKQE